MTRPGAGHNDLRGSEGQAFVPDVGRLEKGLHTMMTARLYSLCVLAALLVGLVLTGVLVRVQASRDQIAVRRAAAEATVTRAQMSAAEVQTLRTRLAAVEAEATACHMAAQEREAQLEEAAVRWLATHAADVGYRRHDHHQKQDALRARTRRDLVVRRRVSGYVPSVLGPSAVR